MSRVRDSISKLGHCAVLSGLGGMGKYSCPWRIPDKLTRARVLAHATRANNDPHPIRHANAAKRQVTGSVSRYGLAV